MSVPVPWYLLVPPVYQLVRELQTVGAERSAQPLHSSAAVVSNT